MKVIDLTHTITEKMPVFPGTEQPQLITVNNYDENGFRETLLKITTHTGTHIDPPAHVYSGKATLDSLPAGTIYRQSAGDRLPQHKTRRPHYLAAHNGLRR